MEFEKNTPVSDEQRRLAETKKLTLEPVHTNVTPDDVSDSEIANSHINGQPISNISTDIEQDTPTLYQAGERSPSDTPAPRKQSAVILVVTIGVASVFIATSLLIALQL